MTGPSKSMRAAPVASAIIISPPPCSCSRSPGRPRRCASRRRARRTGARAAIGGDHLRPRRGPSRRPRSPRRRGSPSDRRAATAAAPAAAGAARSPPAGRRRPRSQPMRDPGPVSVDHSERPRPERDLTHRAQHPGSDLSGRQQAAGRLPDAPAEADRRLADADRAERDLARPPRRRWRSARRRSRRRRADAGPSRGRCRAPRARSGNRPTRRRDRYSKLAAATRILCPRRSVPAQP